MEKENIKFSVEKLFEDHLFNPTDKPQWINKLIESGLTEEEARHVFKIAANKYHISKKEQNHNKSSLLQKTKNVAKYSAAGIFTFTVAPLIYIILVLVVIAILGFIFGF